MASARRPARRGLPLVAALSTAAFSHGLMQAFLNPLLPTLRTVYAADAAAIAWLVTGFLLASSIMMPIAGRLGDMFGRAQVLRFVMLIFFSGTVLAAVVAEESYPLMLVARTIQGAAGAMFPLAFGLLRERLSERAMVGGIGFVSSTIAVGSAIAVVAAGPLVDVAGLRGVFIIAAIVVGVAVVLVWALVPHAELQPKRGPVDFAGACLLALWLTGLLLVITQGGAWGWASLTTVAVSAGTIGAVITWILVERRALVPIVDIRLFASGSVLQANALAFLFGFMLFAGMIAIPAFVQSPSEEGFGFSASIAETAIYLLPQTIMFLVTSLLAPVMHERPGSRGSILIGVLLTICGASVFAALHHAPWQVIMASGLMGSGIGLIYSHMMAVIVASVPEHEVGSVSGMNTNLRNIGGAFGAQVCGALLSIGGEGGFTAMFAGMTIVAVVALAPTLGILRQPRRPN